jgi:hypothetical protein
MSKKTRLFDFGVRAYLAVVSLVGIALGAVGCTNLNDPYPYGGGYNAPPPPPPSYYGGNPYYGNGGYYGNNGYYGNDPYRRERKDLQRERERLEEERKRLERERDRQPPPPPSYNRPAPQVERCPSGFSPSEAKCSPEERRRGCRDMRLPGGLGCVSRR